MEELDLFIHVLVNKIIRVSLYTKFRRMTKFVAISLVAILLAACNSSKNPHSSSRQEEDLSAKELLQGIWLDDETESPLMRIEGDTIYYADAQSAPITFKSYGILFILMAMILLIIRLISRGNIFSGFTRLQII